MSREAADAMYVELMEGDLRSRSAPTRFRPARMGFFDSCDTWRTVATRRGNVVFYSTRCGGIRRVFIAFPRSSLRRGKFDVVQYERYERLSDGALIYENSYEDVPFFARTATPRRVGEYERIAAREAKREAFVQQHHVSPGAPGDDDY